MTFYGKSENGALKLVHQKEYEQLLKNLEGKKIELDLSEAKSERTLAQNRLYHGVYLKSISEHTGDSPADLHAYFKQSFLSEARVLKSGEWIRVIGTTTKLKTNEFSVYLDKIYQWALEQFPDFVLPDERTYLEQFDFSERM